MATLSTVTPAATHAQGNGRGGGFFSFVSASVSVRFTSARFGSSRLASLRCVTAVA